MKIDGIPVIDGDAPVPTWAMAPEECEQGMTMAAGYVIKWFRLPAGSMIGQHVHPHAHCHFVISGDVEVMQEGRSLGRYGAMHALNIAAGHAHQIIAHADSVVSCIHYLPEESQ